MCLSFFNRTDHFIINTCTFGVTAAVEPVLNKQFIDQRLSAPPADITVEELTFYTVHSLYRPIVTEAWLAKKEYVVSHSQYSAIHHLFPLLYTI